MPRSSMKCFKQVANVIGEERAKIELKEAIKELPKHMLDSMIDEENLKLAFIWKATPQGRVFWNKVWRGVCPYGE